MKLDERNLWGIVANTPLNALIDLMAEGRKLGISDKRIGYLAEKWGRRSPERPEGIWNYGVVCYLGWREDANSDP